MLVRTDLDPWIVLDITSNISYESSSSALIHAEWILQVFHPCWGSTLIAVGAYQGHSRGIFGVSDAPASRPLLSTFGSKTLSKHRCAVLYIPRGHLRVSSG